MTPTTMQAKAGYCSSVILWYSLTMVSVEPSVLEHLPSAERRLSLARLRVALSVDYYFFSFPF